jgi:hypothetical protein
MVCKPVFQLYGDLSNDSLEGFWPGKLGTILEHYLEEEKMIKNVLARMRIK